MEKVQRTLYVYNDNLKKIGTSDDPQTLMRKLAGQKGFSILKAIPHSTPSYWEFLIECEPGKPLPGEPANPLPVWVSIVPPLLEP